MVTFNNSTYKVFQFRGRAGESDSRYWNRIRATCDQIVDMDNITGYELTALCHGENCEDVFTIMNRWDEPIRVLKLAERVPSLSVGDILLDPNDEAYLCKSFGFSRISEDCEAFLRQVAKEHLESIPEGRPLSHFPGFYREED